MSKRQNRATLGEHSNVMECFQVLAPLKTTAVKVVFSSISFLIMLLSVPGNLIVIYTVAKKQSLHLPMPILIAALALCDAITSVAGQSIYTITIAFSTELINCTMNKVLGFIHITSCSTSLLLLCLISKDRYLHVKKGLHYHGFTSLKQATLGITMSFFISMVIAGAFLIDMKYVKMLATLGFSVFGVSCLGYICRRSKQIVSIVQAHQERIGRVQAEGNTAEENDRKQNDMKSIMIEQTVNRSLLAAIAFYCICWLPVTAIMGIYTTCIILDKEIPEMLTGALTWAALLSYANGAINPFLYAYRCDAVGKEIRSFFRAANRVMSFQSPQNNL